MVRSPDGDTSVFKITTGALQGDTLAPFLFTVCLDYVLKNSLDINSNIGFTLSQMKSRLSPEICITDINYADDIAITTDSVNAAMTLLHNIEEKSSYIGLKIIQIRLNILLSIRTNTEYNASHSKTEKDIL